MVGVMVKKTILVVDDEKEIAELVSVCLTSEGYEVITCGSGLDAYDAVCRRRIDLALLDVMLPDIDGFTLCRKIRENYYFPIIMLTARVTGEDKVRGLNLGADDYITKPFNPRELVARVKGQFRRVTQYNPAMPEESGEEYYDIRGLEVDVARHQCRLYGTGLLLTPIEFEIVLYLCRHLDKAVTSEEIFEAVWGEKYLESNNTVSVHVARIREKMGENARKPRFIKTVWGIGYKLESGDR